jgi:cytoskeletal protein CcmA (bactofilin family)
VSADDVRVAPLAGLLGPGARYEGDLVFSGRVRIDGTFSGTIRSDDLLEIGKGGRVEGEVDVAQALVAGRMDGLLRARERVTLLGSAVVVGQLITPWLDVRPGAQVRAEVLVQRDEDEESA